MPIITRISVVLAFGAILLLPGCESAPTSAPIRATTPNSTAATGTDIANGRYRLLGHTIVDVPSGRVRQLSPQLAMHIRQIETAMREMKSLMTRVTMDGRVRALAAMSRPVNTLAARQLALQLVAPDTVQHAALHSGLAYGGLMKSTASYTCDDIAIAIYEQTVLFHRAYDEYYRELDDFLSIDVPTEADAARFGAASSEVGLWLTSLNILSMLYSTNHCW